MVGEREGRPAKLEYGVPKFVQQEEGQEGEGGQGMATIQGLLGEEGKDDRKIRLKNGHTGPKTSTELLFSPPSTTTALPTLPSSVSSFNAHTTQSSPAPQATSTETKVGEYSTEKENEISKENDTMASENYILLLVLSCVATVVLLLIMLICGLRFRKKDGRQGHEEVTHVLATLADNSTFDTI